MELVTRSFASQAVAFPEKVEQVLATLETVNDAKDLLDKAEAMRRYAERLQAGIEVERPIAYGVLKIKAKLGELMPPHQGKQLPKAALGSFTGPTRAAYRKIAAHKDRLEEYYESESDVPTQTGFLAHVTGGSSSTHVTNNSGNVEWYTPVEYVDLARKVMGGIDLDPASNKTAQKWIKAAKYYTQKTNGLAKEWTGRVWLNPPYATGEVERFVQKLVEEHAAGRVSQAVLLVNNATDTGWFQDAVTVATGICFPRGRIKFCDRTGKPANSPLQGQAFIYFGERSSLFLKHFKTVVGFGFRKGAYR